MLRNLLTVCSLFFSALASAQETLSITPTADELQYGFVSRKIWLDHPGVPAASVGNLSVSPVDALPALVKKPSADFAVRVTPGMERKRPFVFVNLPVYAQQNGHLERLSACTVTLRQAPAKVEATASAHAAHSVLQSGSWYKIGVSQRGIQKLDYNFFKEKMGLAGTVSSGSIRVAGNGGAMLPENNATARPEDLTDNAIMVQDGGDGTFGPGDYVLFYAAGPDTWEADYENSLFYHHKNIYSDKSYYFVSVDAGTGTRIAAAPAAGPATVQVSSFDDYAAYEQDLVSPSEIGKKWMGEAFSSSGAGYPNTRTINVPTGEVLDSAYIRMEFGSESSLDGNIFGVTVNGGANARYALPAANEGVSLTMALWDPIFRISAPGANQFSFNITFSAGASDALGFLNWIEINARRALRFSGGQLPFRDWRSIDRNSVAAFNIAQAGPNVQVWDVTDPLHPAQMPATSTGSGMSFNAAATSLHEYVAFDGAQFYTPELVGSIANQDLHGLPQTDFFIITNPAFKSASDRLADFHRQEGMSVQVVNVYDIYNEFSSGSQDVSAIRDFLKLFYDRAGTDTSKLPKYVLFMGDASYDYKDRLPNNTNYMPTYESDESFYKDARYANDDFFGFLDDNEYINNNDKANSLDVGIGRLPVQTPQSAEEVVTKIIHYKSAASLGPWRMSNTFLADNEDDAGAHLTDANQLADMVDRLDKNYNDTKIFIDDYSFVSTPGGTRCPDANKSINDQIFKGTFLVNYCGHGSATTMAHERIMTLTDVNSFKNFDRLPFMVTATCGFSKFDNPNLSSIGEQLVLKKDGGAIAMVTTIEEVYAGPNLLINNQFLRAQFSARRTFGEAFRVGKNMTYSLPAQGDFIINNFRKFTLLGDPALLPDFPRYRIQTTSVTANDGAPADSVNALGSYAISGAVIDDGGNVMEGFNGQVDISYYDKPKTRTVTTKNYNRQRSYSVQNSLIYKGKATVKNGRFSFRFIAPKDIDYTFGKGKISYYAENGVTDAGGLDSNLIVGGFSDKAIADNDGPVVQPYMNDSFFRDGGMTNPNSLLFVKLQDASGINISGNGVGHDLTAVLDGQEQSPYTLNNYYESAQDDYTRGYVSFPMTGLANGEHSLTVKAWDVSNNSGEGTVKFRVIDGKLVSVENLRNYPNPFNTTTKFVFEHNHPGETVTVQINVYNLAGIKVRGIEKTYVPDGSRSHEIEWDGTSDQGVRLDEGVYLYRMVMRTDQGNSETAYQKAVLLR